MSALWEATPIIAVGDVKDVTEFGTQHVQQLPPPVVQDLHELYWCQGDFVAVAVVKGELPRTKKYVWASVNPGCKLFYGDQSYEQRPTRVWFLRARGRASICGRLVDGGSWYFYGLISKWEEDTKLPPAERLGLMLLTPEANVQNLPKFAATIWNTADVACSLLGKAKCVEQIRMLANTGDPELRNAACQYLRAQQKVTCYPP